MERHHRSVVLRGFVRRVLHLAPGRDVLYCRCVRAPAVAARRWADGGRSLRRSKQAVETSQLIQLVPLEARPQYVQVCMTMEWNGRE